jgi:murein DD-endopeptidase MepM/ murein hydrolase activator NlpD
MIDRDYRYYIHARKYIKVYPHKRGLFSWAITLSYVSAVSIGIGLILYGQQLPAYPNTPLAQIDHLTLGTTPFFHPEFIPPANQRVISTKPLDLLKEVNLWHNITIKQGDNLSRIFSQAGLSPSQLHTVLSLGKSVQPLIHLHPGQLLQIALEKSDEGQQLVALRLNVSPIDYLEVRAKGDGFQAQRISRDVTARSKTIQGTIRRSLFEDGLQAGLTNKQVMELAHLFGWDIDFALNLREGDTFKVLFEEHYLQGKKVQNGPILAAEFINHRKTYRAIRYTDASGRTDYYTPEGLSMRKAFLHTPVNYLRISSHFNLQRKHPVLNRIRAHKGVDYAAPTGTPIKATGDGKVSFLGRKGGYGKAIILQHGTKYSTLYGHLSRFSEGLKPGAKVKQGEIIGYVGQTGLATGPHLHYEFRVNGVHHNPLTVKLPQANPIPEQYKQGFQKQADKLIAQLSTSEATAVVLNQ